MSKKHPAPEQICIEESSWIGWWEIWQARSGQQLILKDADKNHEPIRTVQGSWE
jgi:hypothetical protein